MSKSRVIGLSGPVVVITGEAAIFWQEAVRYCRAKKVETSGDADPHHSHMMRAYEVMVSVGTEGVG